MTDELRNEEVPTPEPVVPEAPEREVETPHEPEVTEPISHIPQKEGESRIPTTPQLTIALAMLLVILGAPLALTLIKQTNTEIPQTADITSAEEVAMTAENPFANVPIEADAAYVWDVALQKPLYAKNAHAALPLASLTKLMTGLVAYEQLDANDRIRIPLQAIEEEGENGFEEGEAWNARNLLGFTMITSSNDGAHALAAAAFAAEESDPEAAFIAHMNAKAKELGLGETRFTNMTGLDLNANESGAYGSARDMAFLMEHIITKTPGVVADTVVPEATFADASGKIHTATNTNISVGEIINPLGSKTGYTALAGGNLVVAYDAGLNHPIIIAVLGSSREGRFKDVEILMERTKEAVSMMP